MSGATDTLRTARTLTEAGVPDRQADATARAIDDAVSEATQELVTRKHLDLTLSAALADMERRIYRAMLIQTGVTVGAVVALLRLLP